MLYIMTYIWISIIAMWALTAAEIYDNVPLDYGCNVVKTKFTAKIQGCEEIHVFTFGCRGSCMSESTLLNDLEGISRKCDCCMPKTHTEFHVQVECPQLDTKRKNITVWAASSCACAPCPKRVSRWMKDEFQVLTIIRTTMIKTRGNDARF